MPRPPLSNVPSKYRMCRQCCKEFVMDELVLVKGKYWNCQTCNQKRLARDLAKK